ncbi:MULTISPECIES: PIN domain-containing protein [unclassified Spirosoma]|uniref:PIN domain-containing protein n=1 Tax=unclassified Spirosoma TaxID=2621999 RepID=UPI00096254AE|nr:MULTISPECIES: PIN domain-containing protein [unclassified Spirosoma]MBN8825720.1 PIN domain-containing protein [Spirosoma sp.]OJW76587.1 MAG: hypothetical protein BGO59_05880 [Spirosoma sp. 48-14]
MIIFLDSSILIEHSKGNRKELMIELLSRARTLQEAQRIPDILGSHDPRSLLNLFEQATDQHPPANVVIRLMKAYNMLPNDAIILAHCLTANISYLASYDSDFQLACQEEGITLIDSVDVLNAHFPAS